MKPRLLIAGLLSCFCLNIFAQTADDWVSFGRSSLAVKDMAHANAAFAQALALSPTNADANVLYAVTRLLMLPSQPAGSNFLTRLGLPVAGRDIYRWSATLPADFNGLPLAPAGVNANEFIVQLRANVLPAIDGAINNLAAVTNTNYLLNLTSSETTGMAVTVDYADLKLIQSGLYGMEYLIYVVNAQNLDGQLTAIRALYADGGMSIQSVLANYPQLLTFATTNDLQTARAIFTNAVNSYLAASALIRNRPASQVRLFNYDRVAAAGEADFRSVIQDLEASLAGAQVLSLSPNITLHFGIQFTGETAWRNWLPKFDGNAIELGSLPDLTFGGLVGGLSREKAEGGLSHLFKMVPVGAAPTLLTGPALKLSFTTLNQHHYALESSANLADWATVLTFTATSAASSITNLMSQNAPGCFYRLRDSTGFLVLSGQVLDQTSGLPIAGAEVVSLFDGSITHTDVEGQFCLVTTLAISSNWNDFMQVSAIGYSTQGAYYYDFSGSGLVTGLEVYMSKSTVPLIQ